nr:transframe fusion protein [Highlands J virus]
ETLGESLGHLWLNNQPLLWAQLCLPLAALIILFRFFSCCLPFLIGCRRLPGKGRRLRTCDHCAKCSGSPV